MRDDVFEHTLQVSGMQLLPQSIAEAVLTTVATHYDIEYALTRHMNGTT
jgi:hypothetical protein